MVLILVENNFLVVLGLFLYFTRQQKHKNNEKNVSTKQKKKTK
tara:strand:+ start:1375 stop:1503 length:129 start_codon:yes stop_codon:yes gene_type:complete